MVGPIRAASDIAESHCSKPVARPDCSYLSPPWSTYHLRLSTKSSRTLKSRHNPGAPLETWTFLPLALWFVVPGGHPRKDACSRKSGWTSYISRPLDQFLACLESSPHLGPAICFLYIHTFSDIDKESEELHVSPVVLMKVAALLSPMTFLTLEKFTLLGWPSDTLLPTAPVRLSELVLSGLAYKPFLHSQTTSFDLTSFFELDSISFEDSQMLAMIDAD